MNWLPENNKMQQTRSGHPRWRPSLLILVLDGHPKGVTKRHLALDSVSAFGADIT